MKSPSQKQSNHPTSYIVRVRALGVAHSKHDLAATERVDDEVDEVRGAARPVPVVLDPVCLKKS